MSLIARDVMQRDIAIVDASASLRELERSFAEAKVSGFPVVEHGRVVGVISRTDVVRRLASSDTDHASSFWGDWDGHGGHDVIASFDEVAAHAGKAIDELRVSDLMTRALVAVGPEDSLQSVARRLVEHDVHRVLVVDGGQLVGIVSSLDLVRRLADGELVAPR